MGKGAALSMETSDVTLLDSNLEKIEYSIRMGRRVTGKIIQNVVFAISVKIVVLGFALAGMTQLWAAIASDVGAMLIVTLNSMLLLPRRHTLAEVADIKGDVEEANSRRARVALVRAASQTDSESSEKKQHATNACKKGCCGSNAAKISPEASAEKCAKRCCESDKATQSSVTGDASTCQKGCCGSTAAKIAPKANADSEGDAVACKKGCCGTTAVKIPAEASTEKCSKGCCESDKAKESSITGDSKDDHKHRSHQGGCIDHIETKPVVEACTKGCCGNIDADSNKHEHSETSSLVVGKRDSSDKILVSLSSKGCRDTGTDRPTHDHALQGGGADHTKKNTCCCQPN
jgi:hypothetical protein